MLHAVVISNAILGLEHLFRSDDLVTYRFEEVTAGFDPDFGGADVLIVPNGCDHVAMLKIRDRVRAFLDAGKTLLCFDGWFTAWVPGNQWVHDNEKATKAIRYHVRADRYGLFDGVELDHLQFNHGISGWWACGYIKAAASADVVLADTWERPIIVFDEATTNGLMILTASGPLGDFSFEEGAADEENILSSLGDLPSEKAENGLNTLYRNILRLVHHRKETPYATA